jgi:hypothetical protein
MALSLLAGQSSATCPYCRCDVEVPPNLVRELEHHRRQLRVHQAFSTLDPERLWSQWRRAPTRGSREWLACGVCGAPRAHVPGAVDERCEHCGATVVPEAAQLDADVDAAREVRRAADRRSADRRRRHALQRQRATRSVRFTDVVSVALMALLASWARRRCSIGASRSSTS